MLDSEQAMNPIQLCVKKWGERIYATFWSREINQIIKNESKELWEIIPSLKLRKFMMIGNQIWSGVSLKNLSKTTQNKLHLCCYFQLF